MQLVRDRIVRERQLALNQQFTMRLSKPMSANLALKALQLGCSTSELARRSSLRQPRQASQRRSGIQ